MLEPAARATEPRVLKLKHALASKLTSTAALARYCEDQCSNHKDTSLRLPTWLMDLMGRPLRCVAELTPGMELSIYVVTWNCMSNSINTLSTVLQ